MCLDLQSIPAYKILKSKSQSKAVKEYIKLLPDGLNTSIHVGCGKCVECRNVRAMQLANKISLDWTIRSMECKDSIYFLTFTYDDEFVPKSSDGTLTLSKEDGTHIINSFYDYFNPWKHKKTNKVFAELDKMPNGGTKYYYRDKCPTFTYEFFLCGEYGSHTLRPHFHMLIMCPLDANKMVNLIYRIWTKGHVDIVSTNQIKYGALAYVASFHSVKLDAHPDDNTDYVKPFCRYSKPALGTYLLHSKSVHAASLLKHVRTQTSGFPTFRDSLGNTTPIPALEPKYLSQILTDKQMFDRKKHIIDLSNDSEHRFDNQLGKMLLDAIKSNNSTKMMEYFKAQQNAQYDADFALQNYHNKRKF